MTDKQARTALVIGGGLGGIAASLRLRAKGYAVTVVDRCPQLGGRAQVFEKEGFRHDAGPTVITAPFLLDELFALFGKQRADYVQLVPLNPWYRFYFATDNTTFDYGGSVEDTQREIERICPQDVAGYSALLEKSRAIFEVGFTQLAAQPFHQLGLMLKQVPRLLKLGSYRSVWSLVSQHLSHPKLRQAFSIHPLLVGGSPFDTTSIYNLIHYLERQWGIHFAMGGTGALVKGLERLMREQGIEIRLQTTVKHLAVANNRITHAVLEDGQTLTADIIVSNADPVHLYTNLLDRDAQRYSAHLKARHARLSMGLFVLYFGTRRQYPEVKHHTIWLGERYQTLLHDIFHRKVLPKDFSLYIHRPTATDASFAPEGCDSFYVLAPVPNLQADIDWDVEGAALQERIIDALDKTLLPGLRDSITAEFHMTPRDFAANYQSAFGSGFSVAPYFTQSAWFRFHNKAEGPENLYLVGAGTHPGAGVPGVLSSAKVIDRLIPAVANAFTPVQQRGHSHGNPSAQPATSPP
ncbi:MAG: phytoene dehydrogenase [Thiothrix lacustris]|uniref:Phytoene dehydrogenase n=1 Tax=Thiothrix lacustris TaxID=525917 RepID=A0A1Y1QTT2_9GAMM|nr:MAG: phytoene dehydrogenase [Thiothrix lacustris]